MDSSEFTQTLAPFVMYRETLHPEAGRELPCSNLHEVRECDVGNCTRDTHFLPQSEHERQKTEESLIVLDKPSSQELSEAQQEDVNSQGSFEHLIQHSDLRDLVVTNQDQLDPLSLKDKELMSKEMKDTVEMDANEMKEDCAGEHKELDSYTVTGVECQLDLPCPIAELLHAESEISNFKLDDGGEESKGQLDQKKEEFRVDTKAGPEMQTTVSTAIEEKERSKASVEGSVDSELSNVKAGLATKAVSMPALSSLTENAMISEDVEDKGESWRVQRLRRVEMRRTSQKSSESGPCASDQLSDDDSDAMVDDPNDADFVPRATRRSARIPLRSQRNQDGHVGAAQHGSGVAGSQSGPAKPHSLQSQKPRPSACPSQAVSRQHPAMRCANCCVPLQRGQTAYQRKGMPQLFCSSDCLSAFAMRPPRKKPCVYCKKDIGSLKETVFAQNGPSNSFQEFCNNVCLSLYEAQYERSPLMINDPVGLKCSICHKVGKILHEVSSGNMVHHLCSDTCFSRFRATKGLKTSCCDNCGLYIYAKTSRVEYLLHEGQQRRFCNTMCLAHFKKKNTKILPCQWCKTLCKNFDMLSSGDLHGKTMLFCSVCCITSHKVKSSGDTGSVHPCNLCRRVLSDPAYYYKADRVTYHFCSPSCWATFQKNSPDGGIHLNCHSCHNMFSGKPEILDWQDSIFQFCCKECCEDYKRLHGVVSVCEHCKQEKLLYKKIKFSGVEKNFCSEGCILLYKQDFTKKLGLCCLTCTYCSQTCTRAVTEELDGNTWDFCSEECKSKYLLWYLKVARCHACKRQGKLLETIHWRGEIKHYCDQKCLLRFYSQQNQPNLDTQQGPESLLNSQSPESKSPSASGKKSESTGKQHRAQASPPPPAIALSAVSVASRNKASQCRPITEEQGVSCCPEVKSQGCQTDDMPVPPPCVLPIPVPIFVPMPLHMYCQYTPVPFTMPLPVPVPMFLPTTLENADKIVEAIEELKVKVPSNPLEADILAMAEMIAEASEMGKASTDLCDLVSNPSAEGLLEDCDLFGTARDDTLSMANVLDGPVQNLEEDLPKAPLDLNPSVEFLFDCGIVSPDNVNLKSEIPVTVTKGSKRLGLSESSFQDSVGSHQNRTHLNHTYGVNAWKMWARTQHEPEDRKSESQKWFKIKEDILSCTAAELNFSLAQFVKEISSPTGEYYEPDSVYYLCLGIQQYLLENHRMVNIFTDQYYLNFGQELNKILCRWQPEISSDGVAHTEVEEEHLWDCKQLGVYSPFVLLNTLMYFNTKYFGMRTVEQHMELSFANVLRQSRSVSTPRGLIKVHSVCYNPSWRHRKTKDTILGKRKREEEVPVKEQRENRMNPLRCPVKFFEFYLSKCSGSVQNRSDLFYLQPESSCVAESPLWYSAVPVDRVTLEIMLNRILAIKEIYKDYTTEDHAD